MNGISFAALLGAGTWFGNLVARDDSEKVLPKTDPKYLPDPALLEFEIPDDDGAENEILWPSNPLFM